MKIDKMDEKEIQEFVDKGGLYCRVICEILGGPKEHVEKTIQALVDRAKDMPPQHAVLVKSKVFPVEPQEKLFSTFAELEILFKKHIALLDFCYTFLPSSIEVIEPKEIRVTNDFFSAWLNELQSRLHTTDRIAKEGNALKKLLNERMARIIRYNLLSHLRSGPMERDELWDRVGIDKESFEKYVKFLLEIGELEEDGQKLKLSEKVKFKDGSEKSG
ncbi:hypothetical protein KY335_05635 [Candidatus Woesearchaeota archaeon]|nr:hypothetical protein [Candidatus Woesearchaeota archaeon]MBW3014688.1 hypothetical protein [Candidatus Woesearchaeota archaeon]